ncbi:MAG TPA: glutamate 5-kinase [Spirochaetota bacterium]|nr:glutamate 5-kinase [Spirochaetota bacterium]HPJ35766.1 glutamate 5-kinase [Spirochaetota bacterium]
MKRSELARLAKRIVVKIGSSSITENDKISSEKIFKFASEISSLKKSGYEVILVTSGAISSGAGLLDIKRGKLTIPEKQALAAVGQTLLMNEYRECFAKLGYTVGQVLLTEDDMRHRRRFLNARNATNALLNMGVIPVINENDTVVVSEIKFGDNDSLSAHVYNLIEADLLILLSDIDGFYNNLSDPEPVYEIDRITDEIISRAGGTGSSHGTGGMITKIKAAEMIIKLGGKMIIADGNITGILTRIMKGEKVGTLFAGENVKVPGRKKWISMRKPKGTVTIDDGAVKALINGKKSLLASGIIDVTGRFDMGDIIEIVDPAFVSIAKGIVNYKSEELKIIMGKRTSEIKHILGSEYFDEVINRDDMVIM